MPIVVEDPRASTGRGIRSAAASISGSIKDVASDYERERKQKELEERELENQKKLLEINRKSSEKERKALFEEQKAKNKISGNAASRFQQNRIQNKEQGIQESAMDLVTDGLKIAEEEGTTIQELMANIDQQYAIEDKFNRAEDAVYKKSQRKLEEENRFLENIRLKNPRLIGEELDDFVKLSEDFEDIKNPAERYRKTEEKYKKRESIFKKFKNEMEEVSYYEMATGGISDAKLKKYQNQVKTLKSLGFRDEKIEKALASNLNELEVENILSPLSSREKSALNKIPKAIDTTFVSSIAQASKASQQRQRQLDKLPDLIQKGIEDGGSLRILTEELIKKRYQRHEISTAISEVIQKADLTPRQEKAAFDLMRKPRSRTLEQVFGG